MRAIIIFTVMCVVVAGCEIAQRNGQNSLKNETDYKSTEGESLEQYPATPRAVVENFTKCHEIEDAEGAVALLSATYMKKIADMIRSNDFAQGSLGLSEEDLKSDRKIAVRWFTKVMPEERRAVKASGEKYEFPKIEVLEEKIEGDKATVKVKSSVEKLVNVVDIPLIRENGKWKIHVP